MNAGRDYIVEYRTTQFQQGSLVLRFDEDPSPATLRAALIRHGVPGSALTEMSARPLDGRGSVHRYDASTVQPPAARRGSRPFRLVRLPLLVPAAVLLLSLSTFVNAGPAIEQGRQAAQEWYGESPGDFCWNRLAMVTRHPDRDRGPVSTFFSREPTKEFSPANVAYFLACYDQIREQSARPAP